VLVRATHFLGPIALWLLLRRPPQTGHLPVDAPSPVKD